MNETPLHPNMPQTGEQIFCVKIIKGRLEVTQEGTVRARYGYALTENEFTTTHGSRYHMKYFWPGGEPSFCNPDRRPDDSTWMYCTEAGKLGALDRLKRHYIHLCVISETLLQERARLLHQYASDAQRIQL